MGQTADEPRPGDDAVAGKNKVPDKPDQPGAGFRLEFQDWMTDQKNIGMTLQLSTVGDGNKFNLQNGLTHIDFSLQDPLRAETEKLLLAQATDKIKPPGTPGDAPPAPGERPKPYTGENLGLEMEAKEVTVGRKDTLYSLARKQLGADATPERIAGYIKEIQHANNLEGTKIIAGSKLALPGHTADGAMVVKHGAVTNTTWPDGKERFEYADGRKYERTPGADGSYTSVHTGPRPEDNFTLQRTADGKYLISDNTPGAKPVEVSDQSDVRVAHAKMHDLAEAKIKDPAERAKFEADMARFEARARERGLSPEEVSKTYGEIGKLMEATTGAVPENRRIQLAQQVMSQAADPRIIDQGDKNTCNVTAVEAMIYTTDPSKAANLVTQVALTGKYTDPEGHTVTIDKKSLQPDAQAKNHPPIDGERSFATQLFNVTAVNLAYQREGIKRQYQQERPDRSDPDDAGERLYDTSKRPPKEIAREPDLDDDQIVEAYRGITGRSTDTVMIDAANYVTGPGNKVDKVGTEADLNTKLAELKAQGKLPVIIGVNSAVEPFYSDSGGGAAGGSGGGHVVTVTDYNPGPPPTVAVDNQWGSNSDHRATNMPVHDLWLSMQSEKDAPAELEKDVLAARAAGKPDTYKEFELLRLQREGGIIDDKTYGTKLAEQIDAAKKRDDAAKADGTFDQAEHDKAKAKLDQMLENITGPQALALSIESHKRGLLSNADVTEALGTLMGETLKERAKLIKDGEYTGDDRKRIEDMRKEFSDYLKTLPPELRRDILKKVEEERKKK